MYMDMSVTYSLCQLSGKTTSVANSANLYISMLMSLLSCLVLHPGHSRNDICAHWPIVFVILLYYDCLCTVCVLATALVWTAIYWFSTGIALIIHLAMKPKHTMFSSPPVCHLSVCLSVGWLQKLPVDFYETCCDWSPPKYLSYFQF